MTSRKRRKEVVLLAGLDYLQVRLAGSLLTDVGITYGLRGPRSAGESLTIDIA